MDDPLQGVALYRLDSGARIRTYPVTSRKTPRPRQVTFAEDCSIILSGSDHGVVYTFDRRSGQTVDILKAGNDRVQAMTVRISTLSFFLAETSKAVEINGISHVFAAVARGEDEANDVVVWQKIPEKVVDPESTEGNQATWRAFKNAIQVVMYAATVAFIWQNLGVRVCVAERYLC